MGAFPDRFRPQGLGDHRVGHGVVRIQLTAGDGWRAGNGVFLNARFARERHAELDVNLRNDVRAEQLEVREVSGHDVAVRIQRRGFRQCRPDGTAIGGRLPIVETALDRDAARGARVDRDVQTVEMDIFAPVIVRGGDEVVRLAKQRRVDVVQPRTVYPPPLGKRGSRGAVTLNGVKSEGLTARLSVTVKPWNQRHV